MMVANARPYHTGEKHIPGFYWDAEKKRYFKDSLPSEGLYKHASSSKRQKTEREALRKIPLQQLRGHRQGLLTSKVDKIILHRSITDSDQRPSKHQFWASRLSCDVPETRSFQLGRQPGKFAIDEELQHLYIASSRFLSLHDMSNATSSVSDDRPTSQQLMQLHPVAPLRSTISSLTWDSRHRVLLCTAAGDASRPAELLIRNGAWAQSSTCRTFKGALWCSTSSPGSQKFVAAGTCIHLCDSETMFSKDVTINNTTDVMSADFMDANVLLSGCRNGEVQLYDIRTSAARTTTRFKHGKKPTGIAKVKTSGLNQVIVSGLRSTLAMYDMRFIRAHEPLVTYNGHDNEYDLQINSLALADGMLVVAQATDCFKVWNIDGTLLSRKSTQGVVHDLSFAGSKEEQKVAALVEGDLQTWR